MLEFSVSNEKNGVFVEGSGRYFIKEQDGVKYFIKSMELDGSSMVEVLFSTLLGYIVNLPKEGYMDYMLCWINDTDYNERFVGVCCKYVEGKFIPVEAILNFKKDYFNNWYEDYDDFSDFLYYTPNDFNYAKGFFGNVCRAVSDYTGINIDEVKSYFHKQALLDALVCNCDRTFDNCSVMLDESTGVYRLSPLFDFGNGLIPQMGMTLGDDCKPFLTDFIKQVAVTNSVKDSGILRIRFTDFMRDWYDFVEEEYDMEDYFKLEFKTLVDRLQETKGILWDEAR